MFSTSDNLSAQVRTLSARVAELERKMLLLHHDEASLSPSILPRNKRKEQPDLYVVVIEHLEGALASDALMDAIRTVLPHRIVETVLVHELPRGVDVIAVVLPYSEGGPLYFQVNRALAQIQTVTGGSIPVLMIGNVREVYRQQPREHWLALDWIDRSLFRGMVQYLRTSRANDFLGWMYGEESKMQVIFKTPVRLQVRSVLSSFDPTPADFKLGKKF